MAKVIPLRPRGTMQQREVMRDELDVLEDGFDAESFVRSRAGMTREAFEADIADVVVDALVRALVAKTGADPETAGRLARLNAAGLVAKQAAECEEVLRLEAESAAMLAAEPLCRSCRGRGMKTPADKADPALEPMRPLCCGCWHAAWDIVRGYSDACGPDGYPLDRRHPFNMASPSHTKTADGPSISG